MENQSLVEQVASNQQPTAVQVKSEASPAQIVDYKSKSNNFLVVLLSVLLFISLSIAAFFAYRTQQLVKELDLNSSVLHGIKKELGNNTDGIVFDITSAWNLYKNEKFYFEVKYPDNYVVSNENPNKESVYFVPDNYENLPEQEKYSAVTINLNVLLENDINSFVNSAGEPGFSNKRDITDKNINGQVAKQFMSNNIQAGSGFDEINTVIQLPNSKNLLLVTVTAQGNGDPYFLVNQILSTLKFDNSGVTISDWKTHLNIKHGFSLKYPSDWQFRVFPGSNQVENQSDYSIIEGPYDNIQTLAGGPMFGITIKFSSTDVKPLVTGEKIITSRKAKQGYIIFEYSVERIPAVSLNKQIFDQILSTFEITN